MTNECAADVLNLVASVPPKQRTSMTRLIVPAILALSLAAASAAMAQGTDSGGDAIRGRAFALEVCTPCHVVARGQRSPARLAVGPAFSEIANAKGTTAASLTVFLGNPHPSMPNLILLPAERRDVISYILSLQKR